MHCYRTSIAFIFTLSVIFFNATLAAANAPRNALALYSSENDTPGNTVDSNVPELEYSPEYDDCYDDDDAFLEDNGDGDPEDDLDPEDAINLTTWLNSTSSALSQEKKSLRVKGVTCSGLSVGRNVAGAIDAFADWGMTYLVGKRNWHWAGMGGYGEYAIVWMCNCGWRKNRQVNCWELNEAHRLLEDKCGPGQGGTLVPYGDWKPLLRITVLRACVDTGTVIISTEEH
ncbi:hypothetical protein F4859DRAFT_525665 [Xylaria cf. heliscus]|nr:hypothetical protein F4859DRAFT_525665 [Xylaria cf. heliscus]